MAFPDDYRRVQIAGGVAADVNVHVGLPRQILIDSTTWNIRVMDGVKEGGWPVAMVHSLPTQLQAVLPAGEVPYVEDPETNDPAQSKLLWRSQTLRSLFLKIADMTDKVNWVIKDSALRANIRMDSQLSSDLNQALTTGWYRFNPSITSNIPAEISPGGTDQFMMLVIRQSSSELTQMVLDRSNTGRIWLRSRVAGVFQAWTLSTGITSSDLATKVSKSGDTMTGKLIARVGELAGAQLNLRDGVAPTVKEDGDIWREDAAGGIMFRKGGVTRYLLDSSVGEHILFEQTYDSTDLFTKDPTWPPQARVQVKYWSGGGGGRNSGTRSGGGAGGHYWYQEFLLSELAESEAVVVGSGGAINATGGTTSFGGITITGGGIGSTISAPNESNASGGSTGTINGVKPSDADNWSGGAGGTATTAIGGAGSSSIMGGGGGAGFQTSGTNQAGGASAFAGSGGGFGQAGGNPAGGGGRNAAGGSGRIIIRVVR